MTESQADKLSAIATRIEELERRLGEHVVRCEGREKMSDRECADTNRKVSQLSITIEEVREQTRNYSADRNFLRGGLWVIGGLTVTVPVLAPVLIKIVQVWIK